MKTNEIRNKEITMRNPNQPIAVGARVSYRKSGYYTSWPATVVAVKLVLRGRMIQGTMSDSVYRYTIKLDGYPDARLAFDSNLEVM
jgi:uncharacterized membrane protein